jgi:hypothetical protein
VRKAARTCKKKAKKRRGDEGEIFQVEYSEKKTSSSLQSNSVSVSVSHNNRSQLDSYLLSEGSA